MRSASRFATPCSRAPSTAIRIENGLANREAAVSNKTRLLLRLLRLRRRLGERKIVSLRLVGVDRIAGERLGDVSGLFQRERVVIGLQREDDVVAARIGRHVDRL